jgi:hypothetical protein
VITAEKKTILLSIDDNLLQEAMEDLLSVYFPEADFISDFAEVPSSKEAIFFSDKPDITTNVKSAVYFIDPDNDFSSKIDNKIEHISFYFPLRAGDFIDKLRRFVVSNNSGSIPANVEIGPYRVNFVEGNVTYFSKKSSAGTIKLTEKELDILKVICDAPDRSIESRDLLQAVWGYAEGVESHTLETHIYRLRQKIEKNPAKPEILITDGTRYKIAQ